jgi:transposase-like protein
MLAERLGRSTEQVRARRRLLLGSGLAGRPYLPDEDAAIRRCLEDGGNLTALARRLGRSPDGLRVHAQHLGLHRPPPRRRFAGWEDAVIRDGYTSAMPYAEVARQLSDRSATSVAARARSLGLITYARRWSARDDERLAALSARGRTLEMVAQELGRTPEAIRRHAARLGIRTPAPEPAIRRARRWTPQEDELLRLHQAVNPARLAQLLGRSDAAVCRRLCTLGLRARAQRSPHHPGGRRIDPWLSRPGRSVHLSDTARPVDDGQPAMVEATG